MLKRIHAEITRRALEGRFHPDALDAIQQANLGQDSLRGLFGHDEYHFDNNAFERTNAYIVLQRSQVMSALRENRPAGAWSAFGRLTHAVQDFYAHSNYVSLWMAAYGGSTVPLPERIDPVDRRVLESPDLRSGKVYYPGDVLYFIPGLRKLALSILPRDSHAHMNLDSAQRGPNYPYAFAAAVKRTRMEFEELNSRLAPGEISLFTGAPVRSKSVPASYALRFTFVEQYVFLPLNPFFLALESCAA